MWQFLNLNSDVEMAEKTELLHWMATLAMLKEFQLKDLCRTNRLSVSGTKEQLIKRLGRAKRHGSHYLGTCIWCRINYIGAPPVPRIIKEVYRNEDDIMSVPISVECSNQHCSYYFKPHFYHPTTGQAYGGWVADPLLSILPLKDTHDGLLASLGLSAGSQLLQRTTPFFCEHLSRSAYISIVLTVLTSFCLLCMLPYGHQDVTLFFV